MKIRIYEIEELPRALAAAGIFALSCFGVGALLAGQLFIGAGLLTLALACLAFLFIVADARAGEHSESDGDHLERLDSEESEEA